MSAAKDQVVTRIPDATPVQDIRFFEWFLGTLYPKIVAWGSEQIDNGKQQSKYIVQLHLQLTVHVQHQQVAHDKLYPEWTEWAAKKLTGGDTEQSW